VARKSAEGATVRVKRIGIRKTFIGNYDFGNSGFLGVKMKQFRPWPLVSRSAADLNWHSVLTPSFFTP
jgi:hypothetical protein